MTFIVGQSYQKQQTTAITRMPTMKLRTQIPVLPVHHVSEEACMHQSLSMVSFISNLHGNALLQPGISYKVLDVNLEIK